MGGLKTVLHLIETMGPGGAETVFMNLFRAFDRGMFRSVALVSRGGWVDQALRAEGVGTYISDAKGSFNVRYLRDIMRVVRRERVGLIQAHMLGANVYASIAGLLTRTPVVSILHGTVDISELDPLLWAKIGVMNRGSASVVAVSNSLKADLLRRTSLDESKVQVIHNGVPTDFRSSREGAWLGDELGVGRDTLLVCSVGNIRAAKGYQHLIEAAGLLSADLPHVHFLIAGQGKGEMFERLLESRQSLGVESTVHFLGFRSDGHDLLAGSDLFLLPSTSEGFSISTIEAMACGLPVIATRSGGPEEIVTDGADGVLIAPGSGESIAEAVRTLAADPELRDRLGTAARSTVEQRFSLDAMIAAYERIYRDLLNAPPGA